MLAVTLMFMSMLATRCQLQCIEFTDDSFGHYISLVLRQWRWPTLYVFAMVVKRFLHGWSEGLP